MRLMMNMRNGEAKHTPMALYLLEVKKYTLFYLLWKDFTESPEAAQSDRFARFGKACWEKLGIDPGGAILLEIDAFTNTVALCAPAYDDKTGKVIFDRDWYDQAVRDKAWPVSIMLVDDVVGMEMACPNIAKEILTEPTVETDAPETVGEEEK